VRRGGSDGIPIPNRREKDVILFGLRRESNERRTRRGKTKVGMGPVVMVT
jgi:hypothetical protein